MKRPAPRPHRRPVAERKVYSEPSVGIRTGTAEADKLIIKYAPLIKFIAQRMAVRQKATVLSQTYSVVVQRLGRAADDEDVATELGLSIDDFH